MLPHSQLTWNSINAREFSEIVRFLQVINSIPKSISIASLHIENYTLEAYCCRKSKQKGGVCIFVHNSVKFTSLNIDSYCLDQDFEACAIHLNPV